MRRKGWKEMNMRMIASLKMMMEMKVTGLFDSSSFESRMKERLTVSWTEMMKKKNILEQEVEELQTVK